MVDDVTMDVFGLVAESFPKLFIQTSGLEVMNPKDRLRNAQEVVLWDVGGQLFSFLSISFNDCSNFLPFASVDVVVLVNVFHTVRQSADCLLLFFSLRSQKLAKHVSLDWLLSVLVTLGVAPSSPEFS